MSSGSGAEDASRFRRNAEAAAYVLQMISFFLLITYLPSHLSSSSCIHFQITHGTASSSSKAPADRSASAADGANASEKVRHFLKELYIILFCYSFATFLLFRLAQICAQPPTHKRKHTRSFSCGKRNLQPTGPMRPKKWEKCCKLFIFSSFAHLAPFELSQICAQATYQTT